LDFGLIFKRDFVPYFNSKFKIYNSKFNKYPLAIIYNDLGFRKNVNFFHAFEIKNIIASFWNEVCLEIFGNADFDGGLVP